MRSRPSFPNLQDYDIDLGTGFVAACPTELPAYYAPWCKLVSDLPCLLESKTFQAKVDDLELLSTDHLTVPAHWQRAYVTLGFLTQAYIWQDKTTPSAIVPAKLGEPFLEVCEYLGMRPVLSYAGICLWNWTPLSQDRGVHPAQALSNFPSIRSSASFTGTRDEDAFNLVPVMVEAQGAKLVPLLLKAILDDRKGASQDLLSIFDICATALSKMGDLLSVLHKNCDPTFFYHVIRPMLGGSAGAEEQGLPDGVALRRSNGHQETVKCVGGSAGQSTFFQFLDQVLGIRHESKMLVELRTYMPKKHRDFLGAVELLPSLRDVIDQHPEDPGLQTAFQPVIEAFQRWRTKHVAVVSRYIALPAAAQMQGKPAIESRGTAGSLPIPFLKQYRDETTFKPAH
jgi:indoleamine 2,3-dioxygenase